MARGDAPGGPARLYRDLLTARREWPAVRDFENRSVRLLEGGPGAGGPVLELVRGGAASGGRVWVLFNLGDRPVGLPPDIVSGKVPALLRSEVPEYGGREAGPIDELAPFEFIVLGPPSWRTFPDR